MGFCFIQIMSNSDLYNIYLKNPHICTDSRNIKSGGIFFALSGEHFNGNKFALEAINKGCSFAIIDDKRYNSKPNTILVENVLKTLQDLAKIHREKLTIPVIGITGTNGKTTSKELINNVLKSCMNCYATKGNLNNHIGVPLSILEINSKHDIAVIEMGANHKNEIDFLCNISKPTHGVITNIGKAHLKGFGDYDGVLKTKNELYNYIKNNNGILFVNKDDEQLVNLSNEISQENYGLKSNLELRSISNKPFINIKWGEYILKSNLIGEYQYYNIALAVCIGKHFKIPNETICIQIKKYKPKNNRSQVINTKNNVVILDAYNANPSSMKAMICSFANQNYDNELLILGDMLELGAYSTNEHNLIISICKKLKLNYILVGKEFSKVHEDSLEGIKELCEFVKKNPINNKTILIKGSRGISLELIVPFL